MASKRISAFIAQKKLGELQLTRERLLEAYDALEKEAWSLPPREALAVLATGLAGLRHGNRLVHPEVVNLDVTLGDPRAAHERWLERLWGVVRQGRARADVIPLYGGTLGEWLDPTRRKHLPDEAELERLRAPWQQMPAETTLWAKVQERLPAEAAAVARERSAKLSAVALDPAQVVPAEPELELLTAQGRADARSLPALGPDGKSNPALLEFQAAFRLAWDGIAAWDWPERSVSLQPFWSGQRFRLRPKLDYIAAVTVESIGRSLRQAIEPWSGKAHLEKRLSLKKLEEFDRPEILLLPAQQELAGYPDPLGWSGQPALGVPGSVQRERLTRLGPGAQEYQPGQLSLLMALLWSEVELAQGSGRPLFVFKTDLAEFFPSVSHALVGEVLAGLGVDPRLVSLALRVLSVPLEDGTRTARGLPLGLTLSRAISELLVEILVSEVRAALPRPDALVVLVLVDDLVFYAHDADTIEKAKEALQRAVDSAGLALNADKTGSFSLPVAASSPPLQSSWVASGQEAVARPPSIGQSVASLQSGHGRRATASSPPLQSSWVASGQEAVARPPSIGQSVASLQSGHGRRATASSPPLQWGLLELTTDGWVLAEQPMRTFLEATRLHVSSHHALLDQVAAWRKQLAWLWTWLAPAWGLGPRHLETVRQALDALESLSLPARDGSEHRGIGALLRHELSQRYLGGAVCTVPEAWLHWPISAGGLGLHYPPADLVPLELASRVRDPFPVPTVPCTDETLASGGERAWGQWLLYQLIPLAPQRPVPSPTLDGLIARFVERGARLGQGHGELSPYWRWVLTTFGPEVLDAYGSFDFVSTDLVPLSLIRESLGERRPRKPVRGGGDDIPF